MSNDIYTKSLRAIVDTAKDMKAFSPSDEQKIAKSRFWTAFVDSGMVMPSQGLDAATAARLGGNAGIRKWLEEESFQSWFFNKDEFRQRLEFVAELALDQLQAGLQDLNLNPGAKAGLIKIALEVSGKLNKKVATDDEFADEVINKMTKEQVTEFLKKKMHLISGGE